MHPVTAPTHYLKKRQKSLMVLFKTAAKEHQNRIFNLGQG
jgi:hypothetical protein